MSDTYRIFSFSANYDDDSRIVYRVEFSIDVDKEVAYIEATSIPHAIALLTDELRTTHREDASPQIFHVELLERATIIMMDAPLAPPNDGVYSAQGRSYVDGRPV